MKNIHVAFFCLPHPPHVNPALSIVSTLVRRGHRVTFVTSDLFEEKVLELGAEVVRCPRFLEFLPDGRHNFEEADLFKFVTRTRVDVSPFYEKNKPQLVIYDRAFMVGCIIAHRWGLPAITTTPVLAFHNARVERLCESSLEFRSLIMTLGETVDRFYAQHGIHEKGSYFHEEKLNIFLYPHLYQLAGVPFEQVHFYAGRCAAERPCSRVWRPENVGRQTRILVSMSTAQFQQPAYFNQCVKALSGLNHHVFLAIGDYIDPDALGGLPPNFQIVQHVPLIQILPFVNLFMFQGGPSSAVEAMYHGVPTIMMSPGQPDLDSYAANAARVGIGIHLRKAETTAEVIREAVLQVQRDSALANRVKEVQKQVRREPGGEETANRIEEYFDSVG